MTLEVEKVTVEHYNCNANGTDPFEITINETRGSIIIRYCYGSFSSTWWGQRGKLRGFLNGVGDDYFLSNIIPYSNKQHFYADETVKRMKKTILKNRRNGEIDEEDARIAYDLTNDLDQDNISYDLFVSNILNDELAFETGLLYGELCRGVDEVVFDYDPNTKFFINKIFPHVRTVLKEN